MRFLNIVKNCLEHTGEGGHVSISASLSDLVTEIRIKDNGEETEFVIRFYRTATI